MRLFIFLLIGWLFASTADAKEVKLKVLRDLNFGIIKVANSAGSITITPDKKPLVFTSGGVYAVNGVKRKSTRLRVKGDKNTLVYLSLQNSTMLYSEQGKGLVLDLSINSPLRNLGGNGKINDVYIGGTLFVDAFTAAGDYQGDFAITVDYQ